MFYAKISNYVFKIENKFQYTKTLFKDYITDETGEKISVSLEEIEKENKDGHNCPPQYLESLAIYRKICERLLKEDIILFHCSALALDGKAYLFAAPSGTGKSTHARLWRERFGERIVTINDDKPLLKIGKDEIIVYGTPYAGKEGLQTNTMAPVAGIVILYQNLENKISKMTPQDAYPFLFNQTYRKKDPESLIKTMDLVKILSEKVPVFYLGCTISQEAVDLAYNALRKG